MSKKQIKEQIETIIRVRKSERLPKIERAIAFLQGVLTKVQALDALIEEINAQRTAGKGLYHNLLQQDPAMEARYSAISTKHISELIRTQLGTLELLRKRFSRDAVQIAFTGYERQGKSTCLQSITGLNNNVIPAYSGTSCTGAVSVIHNKNCALTAHIEYYTLEEFLQIVREKLKKFFPDRHFTITSVNDLATLDLSGFNPGTSTTLATEFDKFVESYVEHTACFIDLINKTPLDTSNEKEIIRHVAQYEEFAVIPEEANPSLYHPKTKNGQQMYEIHYYNYIAVKSINIYTSFPAIDDAKIVLVDTIGMGDSSDAARIESEMFRILREDCDAAVNLFCPNAQGGGFNDCQAAIMDKIGRELGSREPSRWMYYVLNRIESGKGCNVENLSKIKQQVLSAFKHQPIQPVADVIEVDVSNSEQVFEKLLNPLLDLVTENLADIDDRLVLAADKTGAHLYQEYNLLAHSVSKVVTNSMKQDSDSFAMFERYYGELMYVSKLKRQKEAYRKKSNEPCVEVKECLDVAIEGLFDNVPSIDLIIKDVEETSQSHFEIYLHYLDVYRNNIFASFEQLFVDVVYPFQERVKQEIISILFNEARFGCIPLINYAIEDGPSSTWLQTFIDEKVDATSYPRLYEALCYVLDYRINIDGWVEYKVTESIAPIDPEHHEKLEIHEGNSYKETAENIWSALIDRAVPVQKAIRRWSNEFTKIPSQSAYARVRKFYEKIEKDPQGKSELRNFYSYNRMMIWREQFANIREEQNALGAWNKHSKEIADACVRDSFMIQVKKGL